jgi:hypothetical protein
MAWVVFVSVGAKDQVVGRTREVKVFVPVGLIESVGVVCCVVSRTVCAVVVGEPVAECVTGGILELGGVGATCELGAFPVAPSDTVVPELSPREVEYVLP